MDQLRESIKAILTPTVAKAGDQLEGSIEKALTGAELKDFPKAIKRIGKMITTPVRYRRSKKMGEEAEVKRYRAVLVQDLFMKSSDSEADIDEGEIFTEDDFFKYVEKGEEGWYDEHGQFTSDLGLTFFPPAKSVKKL